VPLLLLFDASLLRGGRSALGVAVMAVADASRGSGTSLVGLGGRRRWGRGVDNVCRDLHPRRRVVDVLVFRWRRRRFLVDLVLGLGGGCLGVCLGLASSGFPASRSLGFLLLASGLLRLLALTYLGRLGLLALTLLRGLGLLALTAREGIRLLTLTLLSGLGLLPLAARGGLGLFALAATGLGRLFVRGLDLMRRAGRSISEADARCYGRLVEGRAIRLGTGLGVGLADDLAGRLDVTYVERRVFW